MPLPGSPDADATARLLVYGAVEKLMMQLSMALWGAGCVQAFIYFLRNNASDGFKTRLLVAYLWAANTVHTVLLMIGTFKNAIRQETGNKSKTSTEITSTFLLRMLVAVPVQVFFFTRIYRFGGLRKWVPLVLSPFILFQFVEGIVSTVYMLGNIDLKDKALSEDLQLANISVSAGLDMIICVMMSSLLWRRYSSLGEHHAVNHKGTLQMLQKLIIMSVNTGSWTALIACAAVAMLSERPGTKIHRSILFLITPVHFNTLLGNLNARENMRTKLNATFNLPTFNTTNMGTDPTATETPYSTRPMEMSKITAENSEDTPTHKTMDSKIRIQIGNDSY